MTASERRSYASNSRRAGRAIDRLLPRLFAYADRKRFSRPFFDRYFANADVWKDLPEEWEDNALGMLAAGSVAGRADRVAAFLRATAAELSSEEAALARLWKKEPWRFAVYVVDEDLGDDIVQAREMDADLDPVTGLVIERYDTPFLLYSPASARVYREGPSVFLSALWWNGSCYGTYGAVIPFRSILPEDLMSYAAEIAGGRPALAPGNSRLAPPSSSSIVAMADLMTADPVPFLALMRFSEIPAVVNRDEPVIYCNGWVDVEDASAEDLATALRDAGELQGNPEHNGEAHRFALGEGSPMYDPVVYYSSLGRRIHVVAMTASAYERARRALLRVGAPPSQPQRRYPMSAHAAFASLFRSPADVDALERAFDAADSEDEFAASGNSPAAGTSPAAGASAAGSLDTINRIARRLMENHNHGRDESDAQIAESLGVGMEEVASLRRTLEGSLERLNASRPPVDRFGLSPADFSSLFRRSIPDVAGVLSLRALQEYSSRIHPDQVLKSAMNVRGGMWLLQRIGRDGALRATQAGNLPVAVVEEAYADAGIPTPEERFGEYVAPDVRAMMHPKKEDDWILLREVRRLLEATGLVALGAGRFRLTAIGESAASDVLLLHRLLLEAMLTRIEWRYASRIPTIAPLQDGAGFLLYASRKLSGRPPGAEWVPQSALCDVFLASVPWLRTGATPEDSREAVRIFMDTALGARFVEVFAGGLGLLETRNILEPETHSRIGVEFRTSQLFDTLFEVGAPG